MNRFNSVLFLLISIEFLIVFLKCEKEEGEICNYFGDHKKLGKCYEEYMALFNISHNEISYEKYIEKTNEYFISLKSMEKFCENFKILKECIGNSIIKNCINLEDFEYIFMNLDHKNFEHLQYVINFHQFNYICGFGFEGYRESFNCINKLRNINCGGGYGTNCNEAKKGIQCSAAKAEKECGKNGFEYIRNIYSIGLCYSRPECDKEFCEHEKIREIRNIENETSVTKISITVIFGILIMPYFW
uniref:Uncharacterized protein n=1 Tax=Panagrolaimus sp. PS1159 TaxID=55785 RepID=A0AC35GWD1_9BILA